MQACDLTEDERAALLAGNVATLHRMGVNDFLMGYLARFEVCGLNVPIYSEVRSGAGSAARRSLGREVGCWFFRSHVVRHHADRDIERHHIAVERHLRGPLAVVAPHAPQLADVAVSLA